MAISNSVQNNTQKSGILLVELILSVLVVVSSAAALVVHWGSRSTIADAIVLALTIVVAALVWSAYRMKKS